MIDRREFCLGVRPVDVLGEASSLDLDEATIGDLQLGMQNGEKKPKFLASAACPRSYISTIGQDA